MSTNILSCVSTKLGDEIMTTAERLFAKGRNEGLNQGIIHGIHKTAKNLLAEGVDPEVVARATGLSRDEITQMIQSESLKTSD